MDTPPRSFAPNAVHMIRTVQMIHVQLSAMADQKASILMGASFVIFTLPLLMLGAFAFLSAICAVMAIVPKTRMPEGAPVDLLFFGSFTQLPVDDYVTQVVDVMADEETMLRAIAADVYGNGVILRAKKYHYLEWSYRLFLIGLVAAAGAFVAQYLG